MRDVSDQPVIIDSGWGYHLPSGGGDISITDYPAELNLGPNLTISGEDFSSCQPGQLVVWNDNSLMCQGEMTMEQSGAEFFFMIVGIVVCIAAAVGAVCWLVELTDRTKLLRKRIKGLERQAENRLRRLEQGVLSDSEAR